MLIDAGNNSDGRLIVSYLKNDLRIENLQILCPNCHAFTDNYKYITIDDIARELRDGKNGVSGIGANGKMTKNSYK